jgi:hypothetical protein
MLFLFHPPLSSDVGVIRSKVTCKGWNILFLKIVNVGSESTKTESMTWSHGSAFIYQSAVARTVEGYIRPLTYTPVQSFPDKQQTVYIASNFNWI